MPTHAENLLQLVELLGAIAEATGRLKRAPRATDVREIVRALAPQLRKASDLAAVLRRAW